MADEPPSVESFYDASAAFYADEVEESPLRQHCRLPAIRGLYPELDGFRVLDAGCGTGGEAAWLAEQGADVVGVDVSEGMLDEARARHGDAATFERVDLSDPLPFGDGRFDLVTCQLTLSHLESWDVLAEFERVLTGDGSLVLSTDHPFRQFLLVRDGEHPGIDALGAVDDPEVEAPDPPDYYATERYVLGYGEGMTFYRRPLSAYLNALVDAGFALDEAVEPTLTDEFAEANPEAAVEFRRRVPDVFCLRASPR